MLAPFMSGVSGCRLLRNIEHKGENKFTRARCLLFVFPLEPPFAVKRGKGAGEIITIYIKPPPLEEHDGGEGGQIAPSR